MLTPTRPSAGWIGAGNSRPLPRSGSDAGYRPARYCTAASQRGAPMIRRMTLGCRKMWHTKTRTTGCHRAAAVLPDKGVTDPGYLTVKELVGLFTGLKPVVDSAMLTGAEAADNLGMSERPRTSAMVARLAGCCLLAGVVTAALMFPIVGAIGLLFNRASDVVGDSSAQVLEGDVPRVSTMVDAVGNPIAWLYSQRRFEVPTDQIADSMKLATVSVEDKRFAEHNGVDWPGTLTGLSGYLSGNLDTRGGSTIEQQYVKNYQLLVTAQTDAERRAAVGAPPARKFREGRMGPHRAKNIP